MRLTPLDIQQKEFKKAFRGYDIDDVNEFISRITRDYETFYTENRQLKEQILRLQDQMKNYIEMEKTLKQALIAAQKSAGEMHANARREAELIIKEAELNAERIIEDARLESSELRREIKEIKKYRENLKLELKNILDKYYKLLELEKKPEQLIKSQGKKMKQRSKK